MKPVDASNNPEKVKYYINPSKLHQYLKFSDYVSNADKSNICIGCYTSNWNRKLFKIDEV